MIYFIPGLGADHRVFVNLHLAGYETTVIRWETPQRNETIEHYAQRLSAQVKHAEPIFIGYSFGGTIGAELMRLFPGSKLILLSSVASRHELPRWIRFSAALRLNRMIPRALMNIPNPVVRWFFSLRNGEEKKLFNAIHRDADPRFLQWAIEVLLHWKGNANHRLHHIHGQRDRLLQVKFTSADIIIPDAGHFMVIPHGKVISEILLRILNGQVAVLNA